ANVVGGVIVLKEPAALYRRHDEALTGMYAKETVTGRVARARMVSANHYLFLSEVAAECSHYILNLRARATETFQAASFLEAAEAYQKLSEIQKFRHRLYGSTSLSERATCLYNIAKSGGYTGPPFYAMGVKSAAKDLARVIVGNAL
ncbi:hypothetical protein, partial [Palleronia sp.]|uniref:hypothetical protein n=1 Tax=Palleronia sp. TaxID=1940284 RepID=UPI0035C86186